MFRNIYHFVKYATVDGAQNYALSFRDYPSLFKKYLCNFKYFCRVDISHRLSTHYSTHVQNKNRLTVFYSTTCHCMLMFSEKHASECSILKSINVNFLSGRGIPPEPTPSHFGTLWILRIFFLSLVTPLFECSIILQDLLGSYRVPLEHFIVQFSDQKILSSSS